MLSNLKLRDFFLDRGAASLTEPVGIVDRFFQTKTPAAACRQIGYICSLLQVLSCDLQFNGMKKSLVQLMSIKPIHWCTSVKHMFGVRRPYP